ncbi:hypothetical protein ACX2QB_02565 [Weissella viridescens]
MSSILLNQSRFIEATMIEQLNQHLGNQIKTISRINDTLIDHFVIDKYQAITLKATTNTYSRSLYATTVSNISRVVDYLNVAIETINNRANLVNQDTGEKLVALSGKSVPRIGIKDFFNDIQAFVGRIDMCLNECITVVSQFYSIVETTK